MFLPFIIAIFVAIAVQAQPHGEGTKYVLTKLQKLAKVALDIANVPNHNLIKASCVKEFSFIPLTKNTVANAKKFLSDLRSFSELIEKNLKDERVKMNEALKDASEKPQDIFDFLQFISISEQYFKKLFSMKNKNKEAKNDQIEYINDLVLPSLEEIRKNAAAAERKVKACYAKL